MDSRRVFAVAAVLMSLVSAATCFTLGCLLLQGPRFSLRRLSLVPAYLISPDVRQFASALQAEDPRVQVFSTIWDTNEGVALSRRMFRDVDMDGHPGYRYKPGLRKLSVRLHVGLVWRNLELEDTAVMRTAVTRMPTELLAFASYDQHGFRHVESGPANVCGQSILFLGDSFTDGLWVNDADTFANVYGKIARDRSDQRTCTVNAGVNGYGSLEERFVLEHEFAGAGRPSLIFVMYFPNDVDSDFNRVIEGRLADAGRLWEASLSELRRMHRFAVARGSTLVLAAIPPAAQSFGRLTQTHYQDILRDFASNEGIRFVDLYDGFVARDPHPLYWPWDPHLTPVGHRRVAELLYDATKDLLR